MKISVSYNFKGGAVEDNTATIILEDISVAQMKRVLCELSEMSVNDFARLGALTTSPGDELTEEETRNIESFLRRCCSPGNESE